MNIDKVKEVLMKKPKVGGKAKRLSTGSTLLNLGITGDREFGFEEGQYILCVGDTNSGKTFEALACFAEAAINPGFDEHRLIFDNAENGALMDMRFFFGDGVADRLEPPDVDGKGNPVYSRLIEDVFFNINKATKDGRPFIYLLDSVDSTTSKADEKKFEEAEKAAAEGKEVKGDFGDGKAKVISRMLRRVVGQIERSRSILIIINQTRDNIDGGLFAPKKTRSGGWALEFYAHVVMWTTMAGHLKKKVRGKDRELGIKSRVKIARSRLSGKMRMVEVPIYHSFGIDDVGSCVDYLLSEGCWKKNKSGVITATGIGPEIEGYREVIVKEIEDRNLEEDVRDLVQETWDEIEEACKVERKSRY